MKSASNLSFKKWAQKIKKLIPKVTQLLNRIEITFTLSSYQENKFLMTWYFYQKSRHISDIKNMKNYCLEFVEKNILKLLKTV